MYTGVCVDKMSVCVVGERENKMSSPHSCGVVLKREEDLRSRPLGLSTSQTEDEYSAACHMCSSVCVLCVWYKVSKLVCVYVHVRKMQSVSQLLGIWHSFHTGNGHTPSIQAHTHTHNTLTGLT